MLEEREEEKEREEKTLNTCVIFISETCEEEGDSRLMEMFVLIFIRQKQYV